MRARYDYDSQLSAVCVMRRLCCVALRRAGADEDLQRRIEEELELME